MSIEQVAVTIHYDPGSWPHWHWRAEIVGNEREADYETGMAITRAGANREAKRAARKMMALPPPRRPGDRYTITRDDLFPRPLTKGMVQGKGKPPTTPPPPAASVKRAD